MGRKITETREENEGSCRSRGRMSSACPQIYSLGTSVWGGKFIGTPIVCLHFRGSPWTRKLTELPWFAITFGGVHGPEKQWKLNSVSLLPGWSMGQENHWVSIVPITFGRVHGPENKLKFNGFPLLSGWSMDQTNPLNSLLFHYLRGVHGWRKWLQLRDFPLISRTTMDQENQWRS